MRRRKQEGVGFHDLSDKKGIMIHVIAGLNLIPNATV